MNHPPVAILPSLDEPATIAAVTRAVDAALGNDNALIVNADASTNPATAAAFRAVDTCARKMSLTGLSPGKGCQVLTALRETTPSGLVLMADTDTRNPDPETYRALLNGVTDNAAMALTDYKRYWDEGNLTNHLARPLIAAATGYDLPQPLAGDAAFASKVAAQALAAYVALPEAIRQGVNGYGIDAFLVYAAATTGGGIISVRLATTKLHAPSLPHLPAIFHDAVPVLLHPVLTHPAGTPDAGDFRLADRTFEPERLTAMLAALRRMGAASPAAADGWATAAAHAWKAAAAGKPPVSAAEQLWPVYLGHVHEWLKNGPRMSLACRSEILRANMIQIITTLRRNR